MITCDDAIDPIKYISGEIIYTLISGLVSSVNSVPSKIPAQLGISNFFLIFSAIFTPLHIIWDRPLPLPQS
jgi:hypothetical protein